MGDGRGVMSESGPKPGEDIADAGDREPPVKCDALNEFILELLTGNEFFPSISCDNLDL